MALVIYDTIGILKWSEQMPQKNVDELYEKVKGFGGWFYRGGGDTQDIEDDFEDAILALIKAVEDSTIETLTATPKAKPMAINTKDAVYMIDSTPGASVIEVKDGDKVYNLTHADIHGLVAWDCNAQKHEVINWGSGLILSFNNKDYVIDMSL